MANNKTQSNKFTSLKLHDVFGYDELTRCSLETQLRRRGGGETLRYCGRSGGSITNGASHSLQRLQYIVVIVVISLVVVVVVAIHHSHTKRIRFFTISFLFSMIFSIKPNCVASSRKISRGSNFCRNKKTREKKTIFFPLDSSEFSHMHLVFGDVVICMNMHKSWEKTRIFSNLCVCGFFKIHSNLTFSSILKLKTY